MTRIPDLSIVIATHSRPRELARALRSIKESITVRTEIIIVADDRVPETRAVVSEFLGQNDTYIERSGPSGPALSRNVGFEFCRAPHTLIFDDDDQLPGSRYMEFLNQALSCDCVSYGDVVIAYEDRVRGILTDQSPVNPNLTAIPLEQIWVKNFIVTPAVIFPTRIVKECRQDTHMKSLEDWDFLLAAMQLVCFRSVCVHAAIIYKDMVNLGNRRGSSASANDLNVLMDYLYVYRRWPAPSAELRAKRISLLNQIGVGMDEVVRGALA